MNLTPRQLDLLDQLVSLAPHSAEGADAVRFRAANEDDLDALDDLERRHFLERRDQKKYLIRLPALVAVRSRNVDADTSLYLAQELFGHLRQAYKTAPGSQMT